MKTLKNKLYAVVLLICGYLPVLIDKDATALVFFAFIAIPLFFAKEKSSRKELFCKGFNLYV